MGTVDSTSRSVLLLCLPEDDRAGNGVAAALETGAGVNVSLLRPGAMEHVIGADPVVVVLWTRRSQADEVFRTDAGQAARAGRAIHFEFDSLPDEEIWSGPRVGRADGKALAAAVARLRSGAAGPSWIPRADPVPVPVAPPPQAEPEEAVEVAGVEPAVAPAADAPAPAAAADPPETAGTEDLASGYDVFLSYKREEKDLARALYTYLRGKSYRVWWDNALFAGDNFKEVVTRHVEDAKAVVVLWSNMAVRSEYVLHEARLAFERGSLINMVIDDLPFGKIPEPMTDIHGERLGLQRTEFFEKIALAVQRKVEHPSGRSKSEKQIEQELKATEEESVNFLTVLTTDKIDAFRFYLKRYGEAALYADIARENIARLETEANDRRRQQEQDAADRKAEREARRSLVRRGAIAAASVLAVAASLVAVLQFFHIDPFGTPARTPVPTVTVAAPATTSAPAPAPLQAGEAEIEIAGMVSRGTVSWELRESVGLFDRFIAHVLLPDTSLAAEITFNAPSDIEGDVAVEIAMDGIAGLATIEAGGQNIAATGTAALASPGNAARGLVGGAANLGPLGAPGVITLNLELSGGRDAVLRLTGPGDPDSFLRFLLYPRRTVAWSEGQGSGPA